MQKDKPFIAAQRLHRLGQSVVDIVLPQQALFRPQRGFAGAEQAQSWADVHFLDEPCCYACGFPFDFQSVSPAESALADVCGRCAARPPAYNRARAAFVYNDASRALVLRFKHGGDTEGVTMFAVQMQRAGRRLLTTADKLVPVPLHTRRLVKRRFNQSALLARAISKNTAIALETDTLLRHRHTPSQGGQSFVGRKRNVSGAFKVKDPERIKGQHVVLIDDVMTTGATLESCARTLKRAGASHVDALVLSRVVKPATVPT